MRLLMRTPESGLKYGCVNGDFFLEGEGAANVLGPVFQMCWETCVLGIRMITPDATEQTYRTGRRDVDRSYRNDYRMRDGRRE